MLPLALIARLWCLGVWESLQFQRCVVLFSMDTSGALWKRMLDCYALNGCIFLGSIAWLQLVLEPGMTWVLTTCLSPFINTDSISAFIYVLSVSYHLLWLAPAYVITVLVSCAWHAEMAAAAVKIWPLIKALQDQTVQEPTHHPRGHRPRAESTCQDTLHDHPLTRTPGPMHGKPLSAPAAPLALAAEEVFRTVLFLVMSAEVWLLNKVPVIGPLLYVSLTCCLLAFYCYDYKWALNGLSLQNRLEVFERLTPFFCGFGFLLGLATWALPFYIGAAAVALLYPLCLLIACVSDPVKIMQQSIRHTSTPLSVSKLEDTVLAWGLPKIPVFALALAPTQYLMNFLQLRMMR